MKIKLLIVVIASFAFTNTYAQYTNDDWNKKDVNVSTNNLILGIFNPKNFSMNHSFNVSMMNSAYGNVSVTSYINSMNYKVSDRINVSADISLSYSPYANSVFGTDASNRLQDDLTGLSLSRVAVDYKISENSILKFEYRNVKNHMMYDDYSFYNPLYRQR